MHGKYVCREWNRIASHFTLIIVRLVGEIWDDEEEDGRSRDNIRRRNKRST
jgi:hypothetical protein